MDIFCKKRWLKVQTLCRSHGRGIYKRIDEQRELLELLQREAPDLLLRCPWIERWMKTQDEFLCELALIAGVENTTPAPAPFQCPYPRPWPNTELGVNP